MFMGVKVKEDPYIFKEEREKILQIMHALEVEGVEFASYQLKDVTYQWYKEWEISRGVASVLAAWDISLVSSLTIYFLYS